MPSGFAAALPTDVVLDEGVLSFGGAVFGVSRGGIQGSILDEIQNIDFDGKRSDIALLDRYVKVGCSIAGRFLEINKSTLAKRLNQGGIAGAASLTVAQAAALSVAQAATYSSGADGVPIPASQLFKVGQYAQNVRVTFARGGGGTCAILQPLAKCSKWSVVGGTKDAAEIEAEFYCELDLTASTDTDAAPYRIESTN